MLNIFYFKFCSIINHSFLLHYHFKITEAFTSLYAIKLVACISLASLFLLGSWVISPSFTNFVCSKSPSFTHFIYSKSDVVQKIYTWTVIKHNPRFDARCFSWSENLKRGSLDFETFVKYRGFLNFDDHISYKDGNYTAPVSLEDYLWAHDYVNNSRMLYDSAHKLRFCYAYNQHYVKLFPSQSGLSFDEKMVLADRSLYQHFAVMDEIRNFDFNSQMHSLWHVDWTYFSPSTVKFLLSISYVQPHPF